jgi:uncharacterized membrane protein YeaQ/YmgE (transglycosylase-associated protein family)
MKPVAWTIVACIISWLAAALVVDRRTSFEILAGMAGPLTAVGATWLLAVWFQRRHPAAMMSLMMTGFAVKVVFFAAYVTLMLRALSLRPAPFVASFTFYFIALYLTEALYLKRLFTEGMRASR